MYCLIDWLSFTLPSGGITGEDNDACWEQAWEAVGRGVGSYKSLIVDNQDFAWANGRAPYLFCKRRTDKGVSIFFDRRRAEILIELTGTGCEAARHVGDLSLLAASVMNWVTRIDLTVDILCDVTPGEFVSAGFSKRFKSGGQQFSGSGETFYIGSWKSNRFARVYRYFKPHPRADFLRVEHVFRDESAGAAISFMNGTNLPRALSACGQVFGWQHPVWSPEEVFEDDRLTSGRDPKSARDTVFWAYRSVIPALARLMVEGRLEWDDFYNALFSEYDRQAHPDRPFVSIAPKSKENEE